jgi:spermidine synthase
MNITSFNQDARLFLEEVPRQQYDLIMGDAFNDFSVPYHLTTQEFNERVRLWLAEEGVYLVNMIDGVRGDFLRAYLYTLRQTFPYVYLAPASASWHESPRTTFVLIAANVPLDTAAFGHIDAGDGTSLFAQQLFTPAEVEALLTKDAPILLTDEYAPVDQMLAPVVRGEERE